MPVFGEGLTLAAAGSPTTFSVTSRDEYGNLITETESSFADTFLISVLPVNASSQPQSILSFTSEHENEVCKVSYTGPTVAGQYSLRLAVLNQGTASVSSRLDLVS